jgi:2-(1,2-epoxy-1,2-dihydrophenyl)acetyl-CoA isomerase
VTVLDTGTPDLRATVEDGVALLVLDRPARRNALTPGMVGGLARVLADVGADDEVGAVVLTGAGGAFCAGGDVKAMADADDWSAAQLLERQRRSQRQVCGRLWRMPKPVLAALPGPAAGAGLGIALACDLRYAASSAVLTTAFAKVGLSGDYGVAWFLTRLVGTAKARELLYLSERLDASAALELGLVNAVLPDEELLPHVLQTARTLAAGPRAALGLMKANLALALRPTSRTPWTPRSHTTSRARAPPITPKQLAPSSSAVRRASRGADASSPHGR